MWNGFVLMHEGISAVSDAPPMSRICLVCEVQGPPSEEGGHKCAWCAARIHTFGCSTEIPGGSALEEGFGKANRICWPCYDKEKGKAGASDQSPVNAPLVETPISDDSSNKTLLEGRPPFRDPYCRGCGEFLQGKVCKGIKNPKNNGRVFYTCSRNNTDMCSTMFKWAPGRRDPTQAVSSSADSHNASFNHVPPSIDSSISFQLDEGDDELLANLLSLAEEADKNLSCSSPSNINARQEPISKKIHVFKIKICMNVAPVFRVHESYMK